MANGKPDHLVATVETEDKTPCQETVKSLEKARNKLILERFDENDKVTLDDFINDLSEKLINVIQKIVTNIKQRKNGTHNDGTEVLLTFVAKAVRSLPEFAEMAAALPAAAIARVSGGVTTAAADTVGHVLDNSAKNLAQENLRKDELALEIFIKGDGFVKKHRKVTGEIAENIVLTFAHIIVSLNGAGNRDKFLDHIAETIEKSVVDGKHRDGSVSNIVLSALLERELKIDSAHKKGDPRQMKKLGFISSNRVIFKSEEKGVNYHKLVTSACVLVLKKEELAKDNYVPEYICLPADRAEQRKYHVRYALVEERLTIKYDRFTSSAEALEKIADQSNKELFEKDLKKTGFDKLGKVQPKPTVRGINSSSVADIEPSSKSKKCITL